MIQSFPTTRAPVRRRALAPRTLERPSRSPAPRRAPRRRVPLPAAVEWQTTSLPVLGRLRAAGWLPAILLAVCAVALVYLVQTSGVATTGYDLQRLQGERSEWLLRNEQLKLELAKLHSLRWIEAEARGRLGMQPPERLSYVVVNSAPAAR